jgi:shikimate kinase
MKKVILIGYMGSGKSVIAKKISKKIGFDYLELDYLIEENENKSIAEIFKTKGELYFRKIENQLFKEVLSNQSDFVISTGGGTPCYFDNHNLLNSENCISIYLKASIDTLYNRLLTEKDKRPLIADLNPLEMKEFIAKHLFERSYFYNQATYKVTVDEKDMEEITSEIEKLLL